MRTRMINGMIDLFVPHNVGDLLLMLTDAMGVLVYLVVAVLCDVQNSLTTYILFMTSVSITMSVAVKGYNLFTKNNKNKKINE